MRGVDAKVVFQVRREGGDRGECLTSDSWAGAHVFPIKPHLPSIRAITEAMSTVQKWKVDGWCSKWSPSQR